LRYLEAFHAASFFKTNLSLRLIPFVSKDAKGHDRYDYKNGLTTTVNYEGAAALYIVSKWIFNDEIKSREITLTIPSTSGATLTLDRRPHAINGQGEQMETFLSIAKNNVTLRFKFEKHQAKVEENGQMVVKCIESGLGAFAKTVERYLSGTGADRHLSKLPENFNELDDMKRQSSGTADNKGYQISYGSN
jgi:hypothetical protein